MKTHIIKSFTHIFTCTRYVKFILHILHPLQPVQKNFYFKPHFKLVWM